MKVIRYELNWYVEKLKNQEYCSFGMYGDGEWLGIFKERIGKENAEGTIYTQELCDALEKSLKFSSDTFYFSTPEILKRGDWTGIGEKRIDTCLKRLGLDIEFVEKEIWNEAMVQGKFAPFIAQLRKMRVVIVSNAALRGLTFLNYDKFIEISYPNCYIDGTLERAYQECIEYGKPAVYLISAGLPAALLVQKLHNQIPQSWFWDLGSIWDVYVGIGGQRAFRGDMYKDHLKYAQWWCKNLTNVYENL